LGLIVGFSFLIAGEMTAEIDLTLEFGPFDGIWLLIGLPVLSFLILVIVSPLSFQIHRQLERGRAREAQSDAQ
jgi:hypothetical protein